MRKTPCGLADLARAFHSLHPSHTECAAIARLLGLQGNIVFEPQAVEQHRVCTPDNEFAIPTRTLAEDDEDEMTAERIWQYRRPRRWEHERRVEPPSFDEIARPVKLTVLKPPPVGEMPSYVAEAEELDFHRGTHRNLFPPQPLVPRNQLRSLISDLITTPVPGDPDIGRIVMALARGRLPRQLPRVRRRGFARRVHVIWDTADPMWLFRRDATAILDALDVLAGNAVQHEGTSHGPPAIRPLAGAAHGDTIVVLSALGLGGGSRTDSRLQARWGKFGAFQRRLGLRLVALVPFHPRRWPTRLKRSFRMVHWHRPGVVASQSKQSDLHYLARILSLAAVIDPALLRHVRMKMLPASDGGMEAEFLNSLWVASFNPRVILMNPRWTLALRTQLADNPLLLEAARHILATQRPKEESWERVVCEEGLIYLSLQKDAHSQEGLQRALARVIRSLLGRMRDAASARWALYLFQELPEIAQRTEAAQLLKAVASVILNTSHDAVADIVAAQNAQWIFSDSTRVGVRWTGEHIIVREPPLFDDPFIDVPATRPRVVIVSTPDEGRKKVLRISPRRYGWTRATTLPRLLKTPAGAEYRLDDAQELWISLKQAFEAKRRLVGVVKSRWKDGYRVDIGLDAFLAEKQILLSGQNIENLINSTLEVLITKIDQEKGTIRVMLAGMPPEAMPKSGAWLELQKRFDAGENVPGLVTAVGRSRCAVEIAGLKVIVRLDDFQLSEIQSRQQLVGKTLDFSIVDVDPKKRTVNLTRRFDELASWRRLSEAMNERQTITARIQEVVRSGDGVMADIIGIGGKAFVPASQLEISTPKDLSSYVGKELEFRVVKFNWERRNVVLSRRELLEEKNKEQKAKLLAEIRVGDTRKGVVKNITDFGAFIDLSGIDGLLHITDMSWGKIIHPSELLRAGQELTTIVLEVNREKQRVSLGLRQLKPNPWNTVETKYPVGSRVKGRIANVVPYGVFLELEAGVEGLIHVSELSWDATPLKPKDIFKEGDEVEAMVLSVNKDEQKISLSLRQFSKRPSA